MRFMSISWRIPSKSDLKALIAGSVMLPRAPTKKSRRPTLWLILPLSMTTYALLRSSLQQIRQHQADCKATEIKQKQSPSKPEIVWLTSFPNSGTSYTMTMVERATNLSTATNYGAEVVVAMEDAIPVFAENPNGPFWDGLSGRVGKIRYLPTTFVMTKTHCGGRCIKCSASDYVSNTTDFLQACEKTSGFFAGKRFESHTMASSVAKVIHLLRNPMTNIIARFHLEQKHMVSHAPELETEYPRNALGFKRWCHMLDSVFGTEDAKYFTEEQLDLMSQIPCHAEVYKYVQWHNLLLEVVAEQQWPVLTIHYEDYSYLQNETATLIFDFLEQTPVDELRPFRELPSYLDHFRPKERLAIQSLVKNLASPEAWSLLERYFEPNASSK